MSVAGGSCQEMEPAVDFFSTPWRFGVPCRGRTKLAGPQRPFLPPAGGTVRPGAVAGSVHWEGLAVPRSRGRSTLWVQPHHDAHVVRGPEALRGASAVAGDPTAVGRDRRAVGATSE